MKVYLTTAIDYVNSLPHIGTAYEKIGADVLRRFYGLQGKDVILQMGDDEHSANVQKSAIAAGLTPKKYCDDMRLKFEAVWKSLHINYQQFIQTSEPRHHAAVKAFFARVHARGDIYMKDYEGWYCESCEAFYTEKDLVDGQCPNHKSKPRWLKEHNYFFRLSKYAEPLLKYYDENPDFIVPKKRRNEIVNFVKQGLEDISISRSTFDWGIPLPIDTKHVMYVWFDALINYLTGADLDANGNYNKDMWPAAIHIVGKDITRFHAVIWPAMLMSAELPLPKMILGHGFVYLRGERMSKTIGNVVTPLDVTQAYPEFGADALRYSLMRTSSFGDDSDFSWDDFIQRYNADLANGIGNLVSRVWGMAWKYQEGKIYPASLLPEDRDLLGYAEPLMASLEAHLDPFLAKDMNSHFALEAIWTFITRLDGYVDRTQPWSLVKSEEGKVRLQSVLRTLVEGIRLTAIAVSPFLPMAAQKIWQSYGFSARQKFEDSRLQDLKTDKLPFFEKILDLSSEKPMIYPRIEVKEKSSSEKNS